MSNKLMYGIGRKILYEKSTNNFLEANTGNSRI